MFRFGTTKDIPVDQDIESVHWRANESSGTRSTENVLQGRYRIGDTYVDVWKLDFEERQHQLWAAAEAMHESGQLRGMCYGERTLTNVEMCVYRDWLANSETGHVIRFIEFLEGLSDGKCDDK